MIKYNKEIRNIIGSRFVLHIHYRNPYIYCAGSEKFIISQVSELRLHGIQSIIIFPILKKAVYKNTEFEVRSWGIIVEEKIQGLVSFNNMIKWINRVIDYSVCEGLFIHSFIFVDFNELNIISKLGTCVCVYLHDFCSCCIQYNLLFNNNSYCGSAIIDYEKCNKCKYYTQSRKLHTNVRDFLSQIKDLRIISPSMFVRKLWIQAYPELKEKVIVEGHKVMKGQYLENREKINDRKINVAFVGRAVARKGYPEWMNMIDRMGKNKYYNFFHFGEKKENREYLTNVDVSVLNEGENAMINKLRDNKIDVVVLFSCVPETYSYTYYESISANCFVITSNQSGNIAVEVKKNQNGIVIPFSSNSLYELLNDNDAFKNKVNTFKNGEFIGPKELINNTNYICYLKILADNKCLQNNLKNRRLNSFIASVLYRLRYNKYFRRKL